MNGDVYTVHVNGAQTKFWLLVVLAQAVQQVVSSRQTLGKWTLADHRQRVAIQLGGGQSQVRKRFHQGALGFVELVQHGKSHF